MVGEPSYRFSVSQLPSRDVSVGLFWNTGESESGSAIFYKITALNFCV